MNKTQTIINIILGIAVAVLTFFQFNNSKTDHSYPAKKLTSITGTKDSNNNPIIIGTDTIKRDIAPAEFKIAYFNSDLLEDKLLFYKDAEASMKKLKEDGDNEFTTYRNGMADEARRIQSKQPGSQEEAEKMQQQLLEIESKVKDKSVDIQQKIQVKVGDYNKNMRSKLEKFLEKYNANKGYSYILQYMSEGSPIFYKNNSFDITEDIVNGLNNEYRK
jgi:outer membrane protein